MQAAVHLKASLARGGRRRGYWGDVRGGGFEAMVVLGAVRERGRLGSLAAPVSARAPKNSPVSWGLCVAWPRADAVLLGLGLGGKVGVFDVQKC